MIKLERNKEILRDLLNGGSIKYCAEKYRLSEYCTIRNASQYAKRLVLYFNLPIEIYPFSGEKALLVHKKIMCEYIDKKFPDHIELLGKEAIIYLKRIFGDCFWNKKHEIANLINDSFDELIAHKRFKLLLNFDVGLRKFKQIVGWLTACVYKIKHNNIMFGVKRTSQGRLAKS